MKILFLTPVGPGGMGGVQKHVEMLTKELERRRHEVKGLALDQVERLPPRFAPRNDRNRREGSDPSKLAAWRYLWERRNLLYEADVVHIHDVFWWIAPLLIANTLRRKTYITFHGWEGQCPPTWSAVIQKRLAAQVCRGVLGVGKFIEKWYGVKLDEVTYGAVDILRSDLESQGQTLSSPVTFFGRLEEVNGIGMVIKAFRKLKKHGYMVRFIGDGRWRNRAEVVGQVTGMVRQPEKYLLESKVVVTCSYLAMMETMALGRPIVAVSHNPLKNDYLTMHPAAANFAICRSAVELARTVTDKNLLPTEGRIEAAKRWASKQTPEKLADKYLRLWKGV